MAVKDILERIESDASTSLEAIRSKLTEQTDAIKAKVKTQGKRIRNEGRVAAEAAARAEKERILIMGRLELRKEDLAERRRQIDEAFCRAREELLVLDDDQRRDWLEGLILDGAERGDEAIRLAPRDQKLFPTKVLGKLNDALKAKGLAGSMELTGEGPSLEGGCILVSKDYEVNRSLDALLRESRDALEDKIASILFEEAD